MSKEQGAEAELRAALVLSEQGLNVSRPVGDLTYDIVAEKDGKCFRIQVKSTGKHAGKKKRDRYELTCRKGNRGNTRPYVQGDYDFLLAYVSTEDVWYVLPFDSVRGTTLNLYPHRKGTGQYEKFKEAWKLLR